MFGRLNNIAEAVESKLGRGGSALLFALVLLMLAAIVVRPSFHTQALGNIYAKMASDPLSSGGGNVLGFRVLTPAISWALHLRGQLIIVTNLIFAFLMLAAMYLYFRNRRLPGGDALFGATVMAFSLPTLYTLKDGGYTDAATYLLIFLMWWFRRRRVIFYALFLLALLNRESVVFLVPWFVLVRYQDTRRVWRWLADTVVGYTCTIGLYMLFRHFMSERVAVAYTAEYYLRPLLDNPFHWIAHAYPFQVLGLFTVFKLLWIFPVLAVVHMWQEGKRGLVVSLVVLMLCVSAQLVVAFDSSRMLTMGFLVMVISLVYLFRTGAFEFRRWAFPVLFLNLLIPQLYTASHTVEMWRSLPEAIVRMVFYGQPW